MARINHTNSNAAARPTGRRNDALAECLEANIEHIRFLVDVRLNAERCGQASAEDLAQDVFVEAMRYGSKFEYQGDAGFFRWIGTVARRVVHRAALACGRALPTLSIRSDGDADHDVCPSHIPGQARTPSSVVRHEEEDGQVREELASLPEKDLTVVRIVCMEGRPVKEAAEELRCSRDAAGKRLSRTMGRLRAKFAPRSRES